ncbi:hypothetical protein LY01_01071 [Nonlabens xylanidelens]|uniref:Uncharacterized protein n=1 Tax=Nonlabens xylanidelens TaxID=191564 RepID=A0A2S6IMN1_9FLAO|nr:hypothetical protein [Nonlabens xylanidelens]PPK95483.1 hypothetical protein LY01_01071 [Nonlabens xylanidelens]PQJ22298.1 hypothetical protein BST94_01615 [Nonlabens xylanidelens]
MKKNMEEWFADQDFNTESLPSGHRNRFFDKLEEACNDNHEEVDDSIIPIATEDNDGDHEGNEVIKMNSWFKWSLVAGLAILLGFTGLNLVPSSPVDNGLSSVSPEMAQAQDFFTSTINEELERLNKEQSPEAARIVTATKTALARLELDYKTIEADFATNNDSKTVIAAMIQNFQNRIDLLETALEQIEQLKNLKEQEDETYI